MPAEPPSEHAQRAARTYGAAADHYSLALTGLLDAAGVPDPAVTAEPSEHHLEHPGKFWDVVLGTGYRATVDALSPGQQDLVREHLLGELSSRGVTTLRTDVVFGSARRPHQRPQWSADAIQAAICARELAPSLFRMLRT